MMRLTKLALISGLFLFLASSSAFAQCTGQAGANKFCGNPTGSTALPVFTTIPASGLSPIAGGTVLGNPTASSAVPIATTAPVLGVPGVSLGQISFGNLTSGIVTLQPVAGALVNTLLKMPNTSGTLAASASSPLVLNALTGLLTCPTCATSSGGGAITGTPPIAVSAAGVVSINAPYGTLTANNGGIVYSGSTNLAILNGTATANQMLQSGATAAPTWSTSVWPATTTINQLLYSSSANTVTGLSTANGGILNTSSTGVPSITATPLLGVAGTTAGTIRFSGLSSGVVTVAPQSAAGTITLTLPNTAGTFAVGASAPLALSATTGALTCSTCVTSSGGGAITGTAPISVSAAGVVSITSPLPVTNGGTALSSGTSGGILGFTAAGTIASSVALTANAIVLGGGAGATPVPLGSLGTTTTVLHGNAAGAPTFGSVVSADLNITATSCTNQFVTAISTGGVGTCTSPVLTSTQFSNQGTTTTVLHGNAAGQLTFSQVAIGTDVSGLGTGGPTGSVAAILANAASGASGISVVIASGTSALGTSAISSGTCATTVTTAATNVGTTDIVIASFNSDPTGVTGYIPTTNGMLTIIVWPTLNNVNFKVCNNTANSITPGAITLNWRSVR